MINNIDDRISYKKNPSGNYYNTGGHTGYGYYTDKAHNNQEEFVAHA
jgi:hypothetical protein